MADTNQEAPSPLGFDQEDPETVQERTVQFNLMSIEDYKAFQVSLLSTAELGISITIEKLEQRPDSIDFKSVVINPLFKKIEPGSKPYAVDVLTTAINEKGISRTLVRTFSIPASNQEILLTLINKSLGEWKISYKRVFQTDKKILDVTEEH